MKNTYHYCAREGGKYCDGIYRTTTQPNDDGFMQNLREFINEEAGFTGPRYFVLLSLTLLQTEEL